MFIDVSDIEILEFNRKKSKNLEKLYNNYIIAVKVHTCIAGITCFTRFCRFFVNIISFQHVLHFDVSKSQIEWNLKVKNSVCTVIMLNDHSNP